MNGNNNLTSTVTVVTYLETNRPTCYTIYKQTTDGKEYKRVWLIKSLTNMMKQ